MPAAGLWQGMPAAGPGAVLPGAVRSFRRLSLACGAAIAAIAILAISGHLALQGILASHAEASALAALGHSQLDLTHLVGDEAIALAGEPDPARRLALATALAGHLTTWHDQHATLGDGENDVITGEEWDRGVPPLADVTPEFEAISRAVRDVLVTAGTDGVTVVGSGDAPLDIARIGAEQAAYLAGVDAASEAFHARAVRRLDDLRGMEGGLALLTLSVLAVIAVLTFGPATRGLRRFSSKLGRAETEAHQLGDILAASSDGIVGLSLDGRIVSWNGGAEAVYGRSGRETIGMPVADLVQDAGAASADPLLSALDALRGGRGPAGPVRFEAVHRHRDGGAINVSCAVSPLRDATGTVIGMALVTRDETEANLLRGQILFRALHDPLTETPNRTLFRDRLHQAVARATRRGRWSAS